MPWSGITGEIHASLDHLPAGNGVFLTSRLPQALSGQCGAGRADPIDRILGPTVRKANAGVLDFQRTLEGIRNCGVLRDARSAQIASAIAEQSR